MEPLKKPCASIDARLRDWDVLLSFGAAPPTRHIAYKTRSVSCCWWTCWRVLRGKFMRPAVLSRVALCGFLVSSAIYAQTFKPVETIPVSQIHAGMRGVAYTVFQGTKPEAMDVEVLGVLKNVNGPKGDVILVRLGGKKAEYTGVVAGMSGSPVYLDGKLAGALAFRIGEFSKEPIAGVTPIEEMLEINAMDRRPSASPGPVKAALSSPTKTSGSGTADADLSSFGNYLRPIEAP